LMGVVANDITGHTHTTLEGGAEWHISIQCLGIRVTVTMDQSHLMRPPDSGSMWMREKSNVQVVGYFEIRSVQRNVVKSKLSIRGHPVVVRCRSTYT
jgi:hypothetical protein